MTIKGIEKVGQIDIYFEQYQRDESSSNARIASWIFILQLFVIVN